MKPGIFDFTIYQGTDFSYDIQWISGDEPNNLVGYTARLHIRETISSPIIIANLTTENEGIAISSDPARKGIISISMSNTQTSAFKFNTAVYDLEVISPAGKVTRLLQGTIELSKEVTR